MPALARVCRRCRAAALKLTLDEARAVLAGFLARDVGATPESLARASGIPVRVVRLLVVRVREGGKC